MASLQLRQLEECLQQLDGFDEPKILLEQYCTSAHIASRMLYAAQSQFDDIEGCTVADLGSGCGILSLGAQILGANHVTGFEIDSDALEIQSRNCREIDVSVEAVQCNILRYLPGRFEKYFDTVIMNPPFGTKHNAGTDAKFLEIATKLASNAVYSLHKTSTRDYILKKSAQFGAKGKVIAELRYDLPRAYKFHKRASVDVQDDSTKEPSACGENIQIFLNGNGTKPSVLPCRNGVCEVTVSPRRDEEGNIITDVHVKIVKKPETDSRMNDIPVVDGVRGIEDTHSQPTDFQRVNPSHPPIYYLHNDIPQIQTRYRDGQPWIQGRGTFESPPTIWRYHRPGDTAARMFPDRGGWPRNKPVVDDNIEPPLGKYRGSNE